MKDLNRVELIGRLGADPEVKYTDDGTIVTTLTVATGRQWKDSGGTVHEQTEWTQCSAWHRLAEIAGEYLHKGDRVFVEGRLKTAKWQDDDGTTRYTTELVLSDLIMLGKPAAGGSDRGPTEGAVADVARVPEETTPPPQVPETATSAKAPTRRATGKRRATPADDLAL